MKCRISITIEEDTLVRIREALRFKQFRNKSHLLEVAADELLKERKNG